MRAVVVVALRFLMTSLAAQDFTLRDVSAGACPWSWPRVATSSRPWDRTPGGAGSRPQDRSLGGVSIRPQDRHLGDAQR